MDELKQIVTVASQLGIKPINHPKLRRDWSDHRAHRAYLASRGGHQQHRCQSDEVAFETSEMDRYLTVNWGASWQQIAAAGVSGS